MGCARRPPAVGRVRVVGCPGLPVRSLRLGTDRRKPADRPIGGPANPEILEPSRPLPLRAAAGTSAARWEEALRYRGRCHLKHLRRSRSAWTRGPERPFRVITLTTAMAFVTTVFAHSVDVADAPEQAAFGRLGGGDLQQLRNSPFRSLGGLVLPSVQTKPLTLPSGSIDQLDGLIQTSSCFVGVRQLTIPMERQYNSLSRCVSKIGEVEVSPAEAHDSFLVRVEHGPHFDVRLFAAVEIDLHV